MKERPSFVPSHDETFGFAPRTSNSVLDPPIITEQGSETSLATSFVGIAFRLVNLFFAATRIIHQNVSALIVVQSQALHNDAVVALSPIHHTLSFKNINGYWRSVLRGPIQGNRSPNLHRRIVSNGLSMEAYGYCVELNSVPQLGARLVATPTLSDWITCLGCVWCLVSRFLLSSRG